MSAVPEPTIFWTDLAAGIVYELDPVTRTSTQLIPRVDNWGTADIEVDEGRQKLYWAAPNIFGDAQIRRANIDGTGWETIVTRYRGGPTTLELDVPGEKVYWTYYPGVLETANLDGSNQQTLPLPGGEGEVCQHAIPLYSGGLAFDPVNRNLYFGWNVGWGICRTDAAGQNGEMILGRWDAPEPHSIAVDPSSGYIFFHIVPTSGGIPPGIRRAGLDGSGVQDIYVIPQDGFYQVYAPIEVDAAAGKIYWSEFNLTLSAYVIKRANLNGSGVEIFAITGAAPGGLAVARITAAPGELTLDKDDAGLSSSPGGTIEYTLTYENVGGTDERWVLRDTVPANTTFNVGLSTAGWSCADGSPAGTLCTLDLGIVVAGAGPSIADFAVTVVKPVPLGTTEIRNTVFAETLLGKVQDTEVTPLVLSPQDQVESMDQAVTDLEGSVAPGITNSMHRQLDQVLRKLGAGQAQAAINVLEDFAQHVSDLIAGGQLSSAQGQPLIDAANSLIAQL